MKVVGFFILALFCSASCKPINDEDSYGPLADENVQNDDNDYYTDDVDKSSDVDNVPDDDEKLSIKIETPALDIIKNVNDSVVLPCKIIGMNYVQIWRRNEAVLFQSGIRMAAPTKMKQTPDGSLEITKIDADDQGKYKCVAMINEKNTPSVVHTLNVISPPKILYARAKNNITTLRAGETLTLTCVVNGYPKPTISWHKGEERLGTEGENLTITNIKHRDAGAYRCLADNKIGQPDYSIIHIKIEHKPNVDIEKITVSSDKNYDTEFKCIVHAEPRANIVWQKDGINIKNTPHTQLMNHGHDHILLIKNIQETDFGTYTCSASNPIGETRKEVKLVNTPVISEFIKPQKNVKDLVLTWRVESKSPIAQHELQYRKKGESEWHLINPEVTNGENGIYMVRYALKGLEAGIYETRIRSQNNHGWSDYSEIMPFEGVHAKHGNKHHKKGRKDMKDKHNTSTHDAQDTFAPEEDFPAENLENEIKTAGASISSASSVIASPLVSIALILLFFNRQ